MGEALLIREEKDMEWKKKKKKTVVIETETEEQSKENLEIASSSSCSILQERCMAKMVLRVLLVEADDSTRQIIAALLRKCSYRVAAVRDGQMAWETLKGKPQKIDLVLTEVELPSISGYALLTLVMENDFCKDIPVVMMSSQNSINMVLKCVLKGAADFLVKPVRKNELRNLWLHVWRRTRYSPMVVENIGVKSGSRNASMKNNEAVHKKLKREECVRNPCVGDEAEKMIDASDDDGTSNRFLTLDAQTHVLNHSKASAFSWYISTMAQPCLPAAVKNSSDDKIPALSSDKTYTPLQHDQDICMQDERHSSEWSSINDANSRVRERSDASEIWNDDGRKSRREVAVMKFRLKRKDRCLEKKVRYQSRKRLAEERLQVKGQFVRLVAEPPCI